MRVLECGLVELARYLQVSQADEPHNWGELINRIEARIRDIRNPKYNLPRDVTHKRVDLEGLAVHFRFMKDAWRNFTMHTTPMRVLYNESQAAVLHQQVRTFMNDLASVV